MVTAFILIQCQRDRIAETAQSLVDVAGIAEVYSVAGQWDLVAVARVKENDALARLVTEDLVARDGIVETQTLIAFRQYSRHDLETMFQIGME